MEGRKEEKQITICDERNVKSQDHHKEKYQICDERTSNSDSTSQPLHCQHVLCFPRQRELILGNGSVKWW